MKIQASKIRIYVFWAFLIVFIGFVAFTVYLALMRREAARTCGDFDSWQDAQDAYMADPKTYSRLDGDGDEIACESILK